MTWWNRLWHREKMETQLEKELRFHIDEHTNELIAQGLSPEEARRQARLTIGGPEQVKENCRDARGTRWLEDLWQDFRHAIRNLRNQPGFAFVALLTLALGTGATTVMFTVINGVLLKPLPYPEPSRLVALHGDTASWNSVAFGDQNVAFPDLLDLQREGHFLDIGGWVYDGSTLSAPGQPEYLTWFKSTASLFSVVGVAPMEGRAFLPEEDRLGGSPVAILGYTLWQRHFGGSRDVIGARVALDSKSFTVVGIMPQNFRLDGVEADIYTPVGQDTLPILRGRRAHFVTTLARLRPGATLAQAQTEISIIGRQLAQQFPDTNKERGFKITLLRPDVGPARSILWLLLGAVSLVLLIACANIASLLLARAVSRDREFALRSALGAGRGRLIRLCLTESSALGLLGGLLGISLAAIGVGPFVKFWPGALPRAEEVHLDWRVLLFGVAISLFCGILFGLAPALRIPTHNLERTLRAGARSVAGSSRRLHGSFVISQIALAVVLLVSAGMLGRTLLRVSALSPGVDVHNLLVMRTALSPATLPDPPRIRAAWQDLLDHSRAVPGVDSVTMVDTVPLRQGNNQVNYSTSADRPPDEKQPLVLASSVTSEYLRVMGMRLLRGRFVEDSDRVGSQPVVVIDEVMAQQVFGERDPLGQHLWVDLGNDPVTVVGVVNHVRYWGLAGDDQNPVRAQLYYPFMQLPDRFLRRWSELMSIAVRTNVAPLSVVESLRHAVRGSTGDQVLYSVSTMEQLASDSLAQQRFLMLLIGIFAGLALLLACIGIYGVLAYLTGQRVPEIGVRMALGATARDVVNLVLRQSLAMILIGVAVGIFGALAAARLLERSVEGVRNIEPLTFAMMIALLIAAALAASFIPARRASQVDPIKALRQD